MIGHYNYKNWINNEQVKKEGEYKCFREVKSRK